jgi:hypothetical protein
MGEKPDMFFVMLSKMVGIPPEEFKRTIEQFIHVASHAGAQMDRIEKNQLALIEAINAERKTAGLPLVGYTDRTGEYHEPTRL